MKYLWTLILGMFLGAAALHLWQKPEQVVETPAAEAVQKDGSRVLERTATTPKARPAHALPKGGKAERKISVDVQPERADCPLCKVDLTLVRMPDDSRRVVASSTTGTILGGLDVPILPIEVDRDHPWAAGISRGTSGESWGVWLDRDFKMLRIGTEINKIETDTNRDDKYEARIKLGLIF